MLAGRRGKPGMIVSDNGAEFTSMLAWAQDNQIVWHFIAPGNRCRTASVRASTAACATSLSMRACPLTLPMRDQGLRTESTITNSGGRIPRWATSRRQLMPPISLPLRSAAQPRPAPPIARCLSWVARRKTRRGSNRRWMKLQWQVNGLQATRALSVSADVKDGHRSGPFPEPAYGPCRFGPLGGERSVKPHKREPQLTFAPRGSQLHSSRHHEAARNGETTSAMDPRRRLA
jgi:hypothetical protein